MNRKINFLPIFCLFFQLAQSLTHNYKISGTIYAKHLFDDGYYRVVGTTLYLYDHDHGFLGLNPDDLLGQAKTDLNGSFVISGS